MNQHPPRTVPDGAVIDQMFYALMRDHGTSDDEKLQIRIPMTQYRRLAEAVYELRDERDRARRLAARLEEVVAARTAALEALVAWEQEGASLTALYGILDWAKAQLSEVP